MTVWFLALDAEITLNSPAAVDGVVLRNIPLREFYLGYKKLARSENEIITSIRFRKPSPEHRFNFEKVSQAEVPGHLDGEHRDTYKMHRNAGCRIGAGFSQTAAARRSACGRLRYRRSASFGRGRRSDTFVFEGDICISRRPPHKFRDHREGERDNAVRDIANLGRTRLRGLQTPASAAAFQGTFRRIIRPKHDII